MFVNILSWNIFMTPVPLYKDLSIFYQNPQMGCLIPTGAMLTFWELPPDPVIAIFPEPSAPSWVTHFCDLPTNCTLKAIAGLIPLSVPIFSENHVLAPYTIHMSNFKFWSLVDWILSLAQNIIIFWTDCFIHFQFMK